MSHEKENGERGINVECGRTRRLCARCMPSNHAQPYPSMPLHITLRTASYKQHDRTSTGSRRQVDTVRERQGEEVIVIRAPRCQEVVGFCTYVGGQMRCRRTGDPSGDEPCTGCTGCLAGGILQLGRPLHSIHALWINENSTMDAAQAPTHPPFRIWGSHMIRCTM